MKLKLLSTLIAASFLAGCSSSGSSNGNGGQETPSPTNPIEHTPSNPIEDSTPSNPIEGDPSNPIEGTPSNPIEGNPSNPIEGTTTPAELREKNSSLSQEQRQQIKQAVKDRASRS